MEESRVIRPAQCRSRSKPTSQETCHPHEQLESICSQCIVDGPGVPSDQVPAKTMKTVTRSSGSFPAITGEPGRFAPQLFTALPETKNMRCGCQFMSSSLRYCCFAIIKHIAPGASAG